MRSKNISTVLLLHRCIFLLIDLAVFVFGLQARLAQYKPCPPNPTAAKIAVERRPTLLSVAEAHTDDPAPSNKLRSELDLVLPMYPPGRRAAFSGVLAASVALGNPIRFDLNGAYFLHRPPPTRS